MKTSYETITGNESFDFNKLKTVAKELNEFGLTKKINMIGCKKEEAVKRFLDAIEKIPDEDVQKMPDAVYELNNTFIDILDKNDGEEEKEEVEETDKIIDKKSSESVKKNQKLKTQKYTRSNALIDALPKLGKELTKQEMIENANSLYFENGGSDNQKVANALLHYVLPSLLLLGVIKETQDKKYTR